MGTKRRMGCQEEEEEGTKRRKILLREPRSVETRNAFSTSDTLEEEEEEVSAPATGLEERKDGAEVGSLPLGRVFVLGDSQVRHLYIAFCARDMKRRCVCQMQV